MNNDDFNFNEHFNAIQRQARAGMVVVFILWLGAWLVGLSVLAGAIYVAAHFLSKIW